MGSEPMVFVVDDDAAVRRALTLLLGSMGLQVEAHGSAREFLDAYDPGQPGCLLLDVRMPGMSGLELLELLAARTLYPPAILISAHGDVPMVVKAMRAGALSFLEKPCRDQELWDSIQEAFRWDADNRRRVASNDKIERRLDQLSPGEIQVLRMVIAGKPNKAMADELDLSVRTIEVRRAKIMEKMQVESIAELVQMMLAVRDSSGKPQPGFGANQATDETRLKRG